MEQTQDASYRSFVRLFVQRCMRRPSYHKQRTIAQDNQRTLSKNVFVVFKNGALKTVQQCQSLFEGLQNATEVLTEA